MNAQRVAERQKDGVRVDFDEEKFVREGARKKLWMYARLVDLIGSFFNEEIRR